MGVHSYGRGATLGEGNARGGEEWSWSAPGGAPRGAVTKVASVHEELLTQQLCSSALTTFPFSSSPVLMSSKKESKQEQDAKDTTTADQREAKRLAKPRVPVATAAP